MHPLRHIENDPHDAPIAPDIVPAGWDGCVPARPANDAISREKLFAEIRHAAETAAPKVDNSFRATDVNDIPALKDKSSARTWIKRSATVFVLALLSMFAATAWKHHGNAATEAVASWVPLPGVNASPAAEPDAQPAAEQQAAAAAPAEATSGATISGAAALPPEAEQQIQSMARDLAAMGQQVEQLKATIETLKANQQAAVAPAAPVARAPAPPPKPKVTALPPRPAPAPPRSTYSPAMQATAVPPPAAAGAPPGYQPPPQPYSPPQATTQPNGEPIVRPPMPMPLSDRY
ncbi:MAG: hypothetical protein GY844_08510 [Bradyrhizobium sp.]|nr:hypothetical protein [Bradyrhizobium sp.]